MPGLRYPFDTEAADMQPAMQMLLQTYSDNIPYPHKFNDALVKPTLPTLILPSSTTSGRSMLTMRWPPSSRYSR